MANKNQKASENERLINELPDDIVISSILSRLTINEVARTRLVSRHWNRSWYHNPVLNFENSSSMDNIEHERWIFVNWVNHVLGNHLGFCIDQFKVTFDLVNTYQYDIDTWVVWALSKHVKKLEIDFSPTWIFYGDGSEQNRYALHQSLLQYCYSTMKVKPLLTCLCLKSVNVTTQAVEQLLESCCSTLENLCIENSDYLTSITILTTSLQSLKYFKVFGCANLETIHISAPKLLSFTYELGNHYGFKLLRIVNALSLSRVSINVNIEHRLVHAIGLLSNCFSQLEYLKLSWFIHPQIPNTVFNSPRVLANLKHLELWVFGRHDRSLAGWIPFIVACPLLQRLTLQLCITDLLLFGDVFNHYRPLINSDKKPLPCLKTLEIISFVGCYVDLDVANYVLENGVALQELILQPFAFSDRPKCKLSELDLSDLKIPPGVKLIII